MIIAASLVFAAIFAFVSFAVQWLGWTLFALSLAFFFVMIFVLLYRGAKKYKVLTFALCIVLFTAVFFNFIITVNLWQRETVIQDEKYSVSGTVESVADVDGKVVMVLKNVSIAGEKHKGKIKVYASFEEKLITVKAGDTVIMPDVRLYKNELLENGKVNAFYKRTDIRFNVNAFVGDVEVYSGSPSLGDRFSQSIKDLLIGAMGSTYGGEAYGMLTGDKSGISRETKSAFDLSGISHVLAVSGLHIGFAAALITFVMRKLRARRVSVFVTVTAFLLLYTALADFSPSVIRAAVMTETGLAASVFGRRKDRLSALCFAVCVILVFSPLYLFETGFQMSVGAVLGIILFADFFGKALQKIKIPKFLSNGIGASVSVQIGILPAIIYGFNEIQIYSVIANVILMPLIAFVFCSVFVSLILTAVFSFMSFALRLSSWGMWLLDKCATAVSMLPFAVVPVRSTAAIFFAYPVYFFISGFFMLKRAKYPVKIPLVLLACVILAHGTFAVPPYNLKNLIIPVVDTDSVVSVVCTDGKTYVVGDLLSYYPVYETLNKYGITEVDAVYMTGLDEKRARSAVKLNRAFAIGAFYSPESEDIGGLGILAEEKIGNYYMLGSDAEQDAEIKAVYSDGNFVCYSLAFLSSGALFFGRYSDYTLANAEIINSAAVIRAFSYAEKFSDRLFIVNDYLSSSAVPPRGFSVAENPNLVFDYASGEYLRLDG